MYTPGIEILPTCEFVKFFDNPRTTIRCVCGAGNPKVITTIADMDTQTLLNLPQVLIELAAHISQYCVVSRFQQELTGFNCSVQQLNGFTSRQADTQAASDSSSRRPRRELGLASVIMTFTNWPITFGSA